jgi:hypothetical protein
MTNSSLENENENKNSIDNPAYSTDDIEQTDINNLRVSFRKDSLTVDINQQHNSTQPLNRNENEQMFPIKMIQLNQY